jgi:4-hydroxy-tetrahydrodipicolinate reductase
MDALPVVATTVCHSVRALRVERVQDASTRRVPFQEKIGVGLEEAEFRRRVAAGTLRHVGLGESLHFLAFQLGMTIDRWDETIEPVFAEERLESALGAVLPGRARGVRQVARAACAGGRSLELFFQAALGEREPRERIRIEGEPTVELEIPGGVHGDTATSAIVLNMLRSLLAAPPGLHTMASVALQGCAPAADPRLVPA